MPMGDGQCAVCGQWHTAVGPCPLTAPGLPYYTPPVQRGWECPKCGAVMAPFMTLCTNCLPKAAADKSEPLA